MFIQVIAPGHDYWPLPWYLKDFTRVAYTDAVDWHLPNADLVLCHADVKPEMLRKLYESPPPGQRRLYVPLFDDPVRLRPGVEWKGCLPRTLWENAFGQAAVEADPVDSQYQERSVVQIETSRNEIKNLAKFSHQAMHTLFEIWIQHADGTYAGRAARAAFQAADRLEQELSRFIESGDIARLNAAEVGDSIVISPETMACLVVAEEAYDLTDGAFDVTIGPLVRLWKEGQPAPEALAALLQSRTGRAFILSPEAMTVTVLRDNVGLDLGGVAKGYAIDRMADILRQWGIQRALLHGGTSSVLAMEAPAEKAGWPVVLRNPHEPTQKLARLELVHQTLSCSGLDRGSHIIDPVSGYPVSNKRSVWFLTDACSAAKADAVSTALMVMSGGAVEQYFRTHPNDGVLLVFSETSLAPLRLGSWPQPQADLYESDGDLSTQ